MICPACTSLRTSVLETRKEGVGITRRRSCDACDHRFVTRELTLKPSPRFEALGFEISPPEGRGTCTVSWPGGEARVQASAADLLQVLLQEWPHLTPIEDLVRKIYGQLSRSPETVKTSIFRLNQALEPSGWGVAVIAKVGHGLVRLPK